MKGQRRYKTGSVRLSQVLIFLFLSLANSYNLSSPPHFAFGSSLPSPPPRPILYHLGCQTLGSWGKGKRTRAEKDEKGRKRRNYASAVSPSHCSPRASTFLALAVCTRLPREQSPGSPKIALKYKRKPGLILSVNLSKGKQVLNSKS